MSKRKKNPVCPYCGSPAVLRPDSFVHKDAGRGRYLYVCSHYSECNAYVSANEKTKEPMGTLANGNLRHKRIEAHRWLREKYGMREDQAHIACFSDYICDDLIRECQKALRANRIAS